MNLLTTNFAGLKLRNPIIVGSSGLSDSAEKCFMLERAGAGAIVLKSVFEEQIMQQYDRWSTDNDSEGNDYLSTYLRADALSGYIKLIKEAKQRCSIPIIASINCTTSPEWAEFAHLVGEAGADAIELNIMEIQTATDYQYGSYEQKHIDIVHRVKQHTDLPIIVKLGMNLTNPAALSDQLYANGTAAVVFFNRPYRPDINISVGCYTGGELWTRPSDIGEALRWTGICSAIVPHTDYAISGGVHEGSDAVKAILVGASAVEICTTLYRNGAQHIETMKQEIISWMEQRGYTSLNDFKGRMNAHATEGNNLFGRTQFMKYFSLGEGH